MSNDCFFYSGNVADAALTEWLKSWQQHMPTLGLFAMVAEQDRAMVAELQALCRAHDIQLAGGIFPQLIWQDTFQSRGILLYILHCCPDVLLLDDINNRHGQPRASVMDQLTAFADAAPVGGSLLTVFDGLVANISTILQGIYATLGDKVDYMGVAAGSETFQPGDCLFDTTRLIRNGVLALRLPPSARLQMECGYSVPDELIPSTSSTGNRIEQIDWRPAFEVYVELVQRHYGVTISQENFYQHAAHFPFGVIRADGEVLVRIPVARQEDGSILCVGEIPANALLTVVQALQPGDMSAAENLGRSITQNPYDQGLLFYCAGRRMHMGEAATEEIRHLTQTAHPTILGGALTLGEIGSAASSHYPLFHNATIVAITGLCP